NATVRVTGPNNFAQDLTQSQTIANLATGTYTVTASTVTVGTTSYVPFPTSQSANVTAGATATVTVGYSTNTLGLALAEVASGLDRPIHLAAPEGDSRLFVAERPGRVRVVSGGSVLAQPFLDISARVSTTGEGGLLSLAFDPRFASNGRFYVAYTDLQHELVVERFSTPAGASVADASSALPIIRIPHPTYTNHYGGQIAFGPDGMLYIGTGDGGGEGDPLGNGQNLNSLLGKLLRIDVAAATTTQPYAIPDTNPFVHAQGRRAEIWASGLRNPWRFSFDGQTLLVADVGQERREEVNIAAATQGGLNYGWNRMEGTLCFNAVDCDRTGLTLPAFEYDHGNGDANGCSITGGFVYRGQAIPELAGRYFYSDYCGNYLRSFFPSPTGVTEQRDWQVAGMAGPVVSFGRDGQGELYLVAASGRIYKIGRAAPTS
ncbi:MAG TPA: PQQ-dependent sugar dehydrogenase, partial [Telluria sp.]|nr:PQQ-dependent sugar dehydrogenase [Telluria sp.]